MGQNHRCLTTTPRGCAFLPIPNLETNYLFACDGSGRIYYRALRYNILANSGYYREGEKTMCNECTTPCGWSCESCVLHTDNVDTKDTGRFAYWFEKQGLLNEHTEVVDAIRNGKRCSGCQNGRGDVDWLPRCQFHGPAKTTGRQPLIVEPKSPL